MDTVRINHFVLIVWDLVLLKILAAEMTVKLGYEGIFRFDEISNCCGMACSWLMLSQ